MARVKDVGRFEEEQLAAAVALMEEDRCCRCGEVCAPAEVFCSMCQFQVLSGRLYLIPTV
jgi:hypothetical protein